MGCAAHKSCSQGGEASTKTFVACVTQDSSFLSRSNTRQVACMMHDNSFGCGSYDTIQQQPLWLVRYETTLWFTMTRNRIHVALFFFSKMARSTRPNILETREQENVWTPGLTGLQAESRYDLSLPIESLERRDLYCSLNGTCANLWRYKSMAPEEQE